MRTQTFTKLASLAIIAFGVFLTSGCDMKSDKSSTDIHKLRQVVDLRIPIKNGRWEIFGTPEYSDGVPGPTYLITFIAQIEPVGEPKFESGPSTGQVPIAPEAARAWISEPFRSMLAKYQNDSIDVSAVKDCGKFEALLQKGRKPVQGFICNHSGKWLVYLTLWSEIQT